LRPEAAQPADDLLHVRQLLRALDLRVRGEDLLEQRRARARQPDDEYRIRTRAAPALAGGEELSRAHPDLLAGVALDELRAVTALGTLQLVAELVGLEGCGELAPVLQPLAERKAQVIAVVECGAGSFLGAAHARQLLVGKTVGLEVGEAPVGIAE